MADFFRIGTFNVFNLVLPGLDYYRPATAYAEDEFHDKTDWIGRQLDEMQADIVGFQEVFRRDALHVALMKSKRFADVQPIVLATQENEVPASTPAVALASRFEVLESESIAMIPAGAQLSFPRDPTAATQGATVTAEETVKLAITHFSRPVLKARIRVTGQLTVTVFVAHLKSKRPTYLAGETAADPVHRALGAARSLILRAAEAAGLRALVAAEATGNRKPVVVIGDVNDGALAVTTKMIAGEPPYYRLPYRQKTKAVGCSAVYRAATSGQDEHT